MVRKQIIVENYPVLRKNQKIEKAHRVSGSLARKYRLSSELPIITFSVNNLNMSLKE